MLFCGLEGTVNGGNDETRFVSSRGSVPWKLEARGPPFVPPGARFVQRKERLPTDSMKSGREYLVPLDHTGHAARLVCPRNGRRYRRHAPKLKAQLERRSSVGRDPPPVRLTPDAFGLQEAIVAGVVGPGPLGAQGSPGLIPRCICASLFSFLSPSTLVISRRQSDPSGSYRSAFAHYCTRRRFITTFASIQSRDIRSRTKSKTHRR